MGTATTTKPVNAGQLSVELGRVAIQVRDGDPLTVRCPAVDDATLAAALDAHAADPNWTDPNPPPPTPAQIREDDAHEAIDRLAALPNVRTKLRAVVRGDDTLTAAQLQRVAAAVALDAIRNREDT